MNYKILLLFFCLFTLPVVAQESDAYKNALKTFQENFNAQNIDAVYDLYSADMQEAMTKEGVTRFVKGCHEQFGNLKNVTYQSTTDDGINSYNAEFDKITLVMELMLTDDGKIASIQFQE